MRQAAWLLAGTLCALQAAAQEHPLAIRVGASQSWDSNVFRVPDSAPDPQLARGIEGKSDRYGTAHFGARLDKEYSQQRFVLAFTERFIRYDKFDFLDRDELDYNAEWHWRAASRLSGSLRSTRRESLVPFEDTLGRGRNEVVNIENGAAADAWLYAGWHALGGISQTKRTNSQVFLAQPNTRQDNYDLGVRYLTDADNSVTYTERSSRGENFGELVDLTLTNEFTVRESSLSGTWRSGGAQTLNGRLYRTEYRYPNTPGRDFYGYGYELRHIWALTGALTSTVAATRAVAPWTAGLEASYRIDETLSFAPAWRLSDKISTSFRAYRTETEFLGAILPGLNQERRDVQRGISVAVSWTPFERVGLNATFSREMRSSADPTGQFDASIVALDAVVSF